MNETNAIKLLQCLGVDNATAHGDWLRSSCPLAFHRHRAGKDSKPSFGLYIEPEGKSGYLCYSCQIRGRDLNALVWEIIYARKAPAYPPPDMDLVLAQEIIGNETDTGYTVADDWSLHPPKQEFTELPGWWLESFPSVFKFADAMSYLKKRGVPPSLWSDLELRYDTGRKMIGFPFFSMAGKLAGMRGRSITASGSYAHHDYSWNSNNNTKLVLYNENNIDWKKPVVVVEGEFDLCKVVQYYPNAVANLTATLSAPKLATLELAVSIVGFFDFDEAGLLASEKMKQRFGYAYKAVEYPKGLLRADGRPIKDPADMTVQQISMALQPYV